MASRAAGAAPGRVVGLALPVDAEAADGGRAVPVDPGGVMAEDVTTGASLIATDAASIGTKTSHEPRAAMGVKP